MNTITQTDGFSFARFRAVVANDIITLRKTIITAISIGFFMFFLVEGLSLKTYFNSGFMFHDVAYTLSNIFPLTCVMLITMMGSLMLHDCRRKETRIAVIMLPARQSEKYLSRITVCLFGILLGILIHVVLYYLFLGLHFAFQSNVELPANMSEPWQYLNPFGYYGRIVVYNHGANSVHELSNLAVMAFMVMCLWSCYILGGTIWKKGSWIITSAVLLALSFVSAGMLKDNHSFTIFLNATTYIEDFMLNMVICLTITALNIMVSYLIFKRMQVTHKKLSDLLGRHRRT